MPTLSEKAIKSLPIPDKGNRIVFDEHKDSPKGFGVRVTAKGGIAFIMRYRAKETGRDRLITIGKWPTWTVAAARAKASDYRRQTDTGSDILQKRREERKQPLLQNIVEDFCSKMTDKLKSGNDIRSVLTRYLVNGIGGNTRLVDIRRPQVRDLVEALAKDHPRQAALLLTYTKQLFEWAEDHEIIIGNPVATLKPAKIDKGMNPLNFQRGRVLGDAEIKSLWDKAEHCGIHKLTALCLKLILVTGQRPGEVAGLHQKEISGGIWTIPASRRGKTQTGHTVPLTEMALDIIEQAQQEVKRLSNRRGVKPSGLIFETRANSSPAVNALDRAVKRYVNALGNKNAERWGHWRPHDLRRTCRTGLAAAGISETVAELTIGHTRKGIAATYDLHRYDAEKKQALEAWERRLLNVVIGTEAIDNVVVFSAR